MKAFSTVHCIAIHKEGMTGPITLSTYLWIFSPLCGNIYFQWLCVLKLIIINCMAFLRLKNWCGKLLNGYVTIVTSYDTKGTNHYLLLLLNLLLSWLHIRICSLEQFYIFWTGEGRECLNDKRYFIKVCVNIISGDNGVSVVSWPGHYTTELGRVVGGGNEEGGISMRCCLEEWCHYVATFILWHHTITAAGTYWYLVHNVATSLICVGVSGNLFERLPLNRAIGNNRADGDTLDRQNLNIPGPSCLIFT